MISVNLKDIAKCCNGTLEGENIQIGSVTTDSRSVENNELFVALKGERFDAHNFINDAIKNGAKALVVDRDVDISVPYVKVLDTRIALGKIGSYVRDKLNPIIVGITGTCGKTTVKDLTRSILSLAGETLATDGNFNNDIGVPLTLLRLNENHKYAIVEMGTNHPGEIAYTANLVRPDVAMINNVGYAHLEGFGSLEGVFRAKSEIFEFLNNNSYGVAIFNKDSEFFNQFEKEQNNWKLGSFSIKDSTSTTYASDIECDGLGRPGFILHNPAGEISVQLKIAGTHNVGNACAAATVAYFLGLGLDVIKKGLESYVSYQGRLKITERNNITMIDDAYNASVNAVYAAIETLTTISGYKILILGDMGELGDQAEKLHREVGLKVRDSAIDLFLTVGELTKYSTGICGIKSLHFDSKDEICSWLSENLDRSRKNVILVKGSHSMHMQDVLKYIEEKLC